MPGRNARNHTDDDVDVVDTRDRNHPRVRKPRPPSPQQAGPGASQRRRRILVGAAVLVVAWLVFMVWVPFHAWGAVQRVDANPAGTRPAASKGYDYVLVGSDSREGLTAEQQKALHTGSAKIGGKRTDSIIMVHVPSGDGKPALISLPRDSYVPIPGHERNKINAAYSRGGPKLLVETIEQATGVRIDGYVEIGFGGFASVVDSLAGVEGLTNSSNANAAAVRGVNSSTQVTGLGGYGVWGTYAGFGTGVFGSGIESCASRPTTDMRKPGVQKPHCSPWHS